MRIVSTSFDNGEPIPKEYSREGLNWMPELRWEEVPADTQSLALICDDPDAPGGTFSHLVTWHIDPHSRGVRQAQFPAGTQIGVNDFGENGWDGPLPPRGNGVHHYRFRLFALDSDVELPENATRHDLLRAVEQHAIGDAQTIGTYER